MNSLSILSSRVNKVIGNTPPPTPHSESLLDSNRSNDLHHETFPRHSGSDLYFASQAVVDDESDEEEDEVEVGTGGAQRSRRATVSVGERIYLAFLSPWVGAVRWILSTIAVSTNWLLSCVYNDEGVFSPLLPLRRTIEMILRPFGKADPRGVQLSLSQLPSGSEMIADSVHIPAVNPASHHRARSFSGDSKSPTVEDISPRRSIRIRLYNEETHQKSKASSVKSPTSPSSNLRLTKYPRIAGPPVPLLSRNTSPKTLILDLDETLIHSLAKGGRMSSGHMVEVKLDRQHAILYYVHKRPYCDEFLRKVAKWYNLVVFTASVQEYADPVIDWLEQDRKYFKGRYYRQHCTNRNGAYIKDLSTVEPDLSKVMIIDNSPMSYIFHEDNAIPVEGWINDPTDIDLLHLIPVLQALQYVGDVRAVLALRMGEPGA
ncbi:NLI interacting factor-like phosphatase-domain-containing protein [Sphaerosporella brunnea]|uniref:NLI interacting factor-like phosphatase-domain-containing protein n=1 Tax=Sphaerosporella brunnea TaxID=1250544 RepID=A0A5J5EFM2_9PEZI|nr:NLI interacting factor-like phosphatase-domain-containing protein [Sphaerosporella brunnea]